MLNSFIFTAKDGKPAFTTPNARSLFITLMQKNEGKKGWLEVSWKLPTRTERQNRYYWAYLGIIAQESGGSEAEKLHEQFKQAFLYQGEIENKFGKAKIYGSTTKLSVGQFCEYIMKIEALTEIPAPDPKQWDLETTEMNLSFMRPLTPAREEIIS